MVPHVIWHFTNISRHCRSTHTPLHTVKAVIIGQDPYHNVNQAHGLCFSVLPPTPAPPSLKNIYKALKNDYPSFTPPPKNGGLLTPWADRGVLLLNTCLTVRAHDANSHANRGWEKFTQKVIDTVAAKRSKGVVFLAWGSPAGKRVVKVNREKHLVLQSVHPSPLSASRGWFDCGHFKKTNEWLEGRYGVGSGIEWDLSGLTRRETTEEIREKAEREEAESRRVDEEIIGKLNEETRVKEEEKRRERERKEVEDKKKKEVEDTLAAMEAIEKAEEDDSEIEI
jgi:uracil-DNA glycosylase